MSDLIDRNHFHKRFLEEWKWCEEQGFDTQPLRYVDDLINTEPSAQPEVLSDGTLHVTVDLDISTVSRILLSQKGTHWGELYYSDALQPERKKGEWIPEFDGKFTGGAYWFSCSKCKRIVPDVRNGGWNFCHDCGADLRGDSDDKSK